MKLFENERCHLLTGNLARESHSLKVAQLSRFIDDDLGWGVPWWLPLQEKEEVAAVISIIPF